MPPNIFPFLKRSSFFSHLERWLIPTREWDGSMFKANVFHLDQTAER